MLKETNPELLTGTIEADETFVGGKEANKHMSKRITSKKENGKRVSKAQPDKKTMVLGILQRDGKVRSIVVPNTRGNSLQPLMRANVEPNARIITDALRSYIDLKKDYQHVSIKHTPGNFITKGDEHTNNIEGYWSILKRGIIGTFHSVSPQHLQRYCNEFDYRYNTRSITPAERFADGVKNAHNARLTYKVLTATKKATK